MVVARSPASSASTWRWNSATMASCSADKVVISGLPSFRRSSESIPALPRNLPPPAPSAFFGPVQPLPAGGKLRYLTMEGSTATWRGRNPELTEETMREIGHFIGGKQVAGTSGRSGDVFNPNTGEVQAKVAFAAKSEVEKAVANAEAAQATWAATNPQRRARVMFKFLELVQKEFDQLARLLSSEHGKTFADSRGDIQRGLEVVEFACGIP